MNENSLAVEFDLNFRYAEQEQSALTDVCGEIRSGQCIVLCGSSGCGKSTVLRCINHLIPEFYEGELKGFCRIQGADRSKSSVGEIGELAASVFQDPRSQFFTLNSSTEVAFGLENFGIPHDEMVRRTARAFDAFHLSFLKNRNVFSLSSGQRQLVAILSAWAMDTDLFLLDEPTANLDFASIQQLETALKSLKRAGKTLIISEHRLAYLHDLADEYWLMKNGRLVRKISSREMKETPPEEWTQLGLRATSMDTISAAQPSIARPSAQMHTLAADNIVFSYKNSAHNTLNGASFQARTGEVLGLIGANGCGKTTLGKLAAGLFRPQSGVFSLDGTPLKAKQLLNQGIFIMQEAEFQFFTNSVLNELTYRVPNADARMPEIERLLKDMDLWSCREQHPFSLSGGQMQKLVLLMACLSPKPVVILDEPTAGLDYESLQKCVQLIRRMQETKIVLVITHDPEFIGQVCTRCISLENGAVTKSFDLTVPGTFDGLKAYMTTSLHAADEVPPKEVSLPRLDPRTKLWMVLVSMIVGVWTDLPLMLTTFAGIMMAALYERRWKVFAVGSGCMIGVFLLYGLFPCTALSFIANFFPRIFLIGAAVSLILSERESPRTVAGLRKLHVPERAIMILSVAFRFFPVLNLDLGIMSQSIRTRGFFLHTSDKLKAIPEYAEIMIVPMVFRVIRIAEALSASAETRGIALNVPRDSFISLRFKAADATLAALFIACICVGLAL